MMKNPEPWQDDFKKFYDIEVDKYMTKQMGKNWKQES